MPKRSDNLVPERLRAVLLLKLLFENTDEQHALTMKEIIELLAARGVKADRRTIAEDFNNFADLDIRIEKVGNGPRTAYTLSSRTFKLSELKLLVDAVQSSRFITEEQSNSLIRKIESIGSKYTARQLQRSVVSSGRIKSMNDSIFSNVDVINEAANSNQKIQFHYFKRDTRKQPALQHGGKYIVTSPWAFVWEDEKYYLVGFDSSTGIFKHYRVDKMVDIAAVPDSRDGRAEYRKLDLAKYVNALFGMFGGDPARVTLAAASDMTDVLTDRFGMDIPIIEQKDGTIQTMVDAISSVQFLGWIFGLQENVKILGPKNVVDQMVISLCRVLLSYSKQLPENLTDSLQQFLETQSNQKNAEDVEV